jgi:hypothetical protein
VGPIRVVVDVVEDEVEVPLRRGDQRCGRVGLSDEVVSGLASSQKVPSGTRSARATRSPLAAAARQEPALDDWQRRVALDLRLLDL